jgi:hypothetical protein
MRLIPGRNIDVEYKKGTVITDYPGCDELAVARCDETGIDFNRHDGAIRPG